VASIVTTTDKIIIRDLRLRTVIGVRECERMRRQDVVINVALYNDVRLPGQTDDPSTMLDYAAVTAAITTLVTSSDHRLVEALATDIARVCVVHFGAERVVVRVEKPAALHAASTAGVEIDRARGDFDA
jgi:FolB domain-containing protein